MPNKTCPKCQASKHVRVSKCDCGHSFYATKNEQQSQPQQPIQKTESVKSTGFLGLTKEQKPNSQIQTSGIDHDNPGRGKRQCPSCKKYVGAKLTICNLCQYNFKSETKEVLQEKPHSVTISEVKKFDGPGPGRKQCPSCKSYVGVRTNNCSCGHDFQSNQVQKTEKPKSQPSKLFPVFKQETPKFLSIIKEEKAKEKKAEEKQKEKEAVTWRSPGKGRKKCDNQSCDKYVPVAARNCVCGFVFERKEDDTPELGTFLKYKKSNVDQKQFTFNLPGLLDSNLQILRDVNFSIINPINLCLEEIDEELVFLHKIEGLGTKSPEQLKNWLIDRFDILGEVKWEWLSSQDSDIKENRYPLHLRKTYFGQLIRNKPETLVSYDPIKLEWERYKYLKSSEKYQPSIFVVNEETTDPYKYPWWYKIEYWKEHWPPSEDSFKEFLSRRNKYLQNKQLRKNYNV